MAGIGMALRGSRMMGHVFRRVGGMREGTLAMLAARGCGGAQQKCGMAGEIASGGMGKTFQDKEHAQEAVFFQKEEKELLKKLAKKLGSTPEQKAADEALIKAICAKHNVPVSSAFVDDLVHFKHSH